MYEDRPTHAGKSAVVEDREAGGDHHETFEITRNGLRAAVLIGADDYDSMVETLAVLSDVKLAKDRGMALRIWQRAEFSAPLKSGLL